VWSKVWGKMEWDAMGKLTAAKIRSLSEPGKYSDGKSSARSFLRIQVNKIRRDIGLGSL